MSYSVLLTFLWTVRSILFANCPGACPVTVALVSIINHTALFISLQEMRAQRKEESLQKLLMCQVNVNDTIAHIQTAGCMTAIM